MKAEDFFSLDTKKPEKNYLVYVTIDEAVRKDQPNLGEIGEKNFLIRLPNGDEIDFATFDPTNKKQLWEILWNMQACNNQSIQQANGRIGDLQERADRLNELL